MDYEANNGVAGLIDNCNSASSQLIRSQRQVQLGTGQGLASSLSVKAAVSCVWKMHEHLTYTVEVF